MAKVTKRPPIRSKLVKYFQNHPGEIVHLEDMAKAIHEDSKRVQNGVANLAYSNTLPVDIVIRGRAWRYDPDKKPAKRTKRMFQEIGPSKDGSIIIECEDGKLFKAVEL